MAIYDSYKDTQSRKEYGSLARQKTCECFKCITPSETRQGDIPGAGIIL